VKSIGCAKFRSRTHEAVIRVYDDAGNVMGHINARWCAHHGRIMQHPAIKNDSGTIL
jgi:hypothetical protein